MRFCTFDTETRADETGVNTFAIGGLYDGVNFEYALTATDFMQKMGEMASPDCVFYAHNSGFDVPIVFFDGNLPKNFTIEGVFAIKNSLYLDCDFENVKFKIHDSLTLFNDSLKNLCKSFEVETPKLDFDIKRWQAEGSKITDDLIFYNRVDCISLHQVLSRGFSILKSLGVTEIKKTMAATSFNFFQNQLFEGEPLSVFTANLPKKIEDVARLCYYGGHTENYYIGKIDNGKVNHIDERSEYPSTMVLYSYPIFFNSWKKYKSADYEKVLNPETAAVLECVVQIDENFPIPPIPKRLENGLEFPVGTFKTFLVAEELRHYKKFEPFVKIKPITGAFLETKYANYFSEHVSKIYNARAKAREEGKAALAYILKEKMNSYYGKFGMRATFPKLVIGKPKTEAVLRSPELDLWEIPASAVGYRKNEAINPYLAASITANARFDLFNLMYNIKINGGKPLYCDTDSVFFIDMSLDHEFIKNRIGKGLGQVGVEADNGFDEFFFLGKKMYASRTKKIAGADDDLENYRDGWLHSTTFKGIKAKNTNGKRILFFEDYEKIFNGEKVSLPLLRFEKFRGKSRRGAGILVEEQEKILKMTNKKERLPTGFLKPIKLNECDFDDYL